MVGYNVQSAVDTTPSINVDLHRADPSNPRRHRRASNRGFKEKIAKLREEIERLGATQFSHSLGHNRPPALQKNIEGISPRGQTRPVLRCLWSR
jgi:hypothetical protein